MRLHLTAAIVSLVVTIAILSTGGVLALGNDDYCYSVLYDFANTKGAQRSVLRPVTHFPPGHPAIGLNGVEMDETGYYPIPPTGPDPGKPSVRVSGGSMFYAYYGSSSNVGFEEEDTELLYFVRDTEGSIYFVMTHDKKKTDHGGHIRYKINSGSGPMSLGGKNMQLLLRDDWGTDGSESTCSSHANDCYAFDSEAGTLTASQYWASCCTDGIVLGPMPPPEDGTWIFSIQYTYLKENSFDSLLLYTYDGPGQFRGIDVGATELRVGGSLSVVGQTCSSFCEDYSGCGECLSGSNGECSWCGSTASCIPSTSGDACPGQWQDACCVECSLISECGECTSNPECGWCQNTGSCMSGTAHSSCSDCDFWSFDKCDEGCPGARNADGSTIVPGSGAVTSFCDGGGVCDWETKTCACDPTRWGSDCGGECEGITDGGDPCNSSGSCDQVTGDCLCECGMVGSTCSTETQCSEVDGVCYGGSSCGGQCGKRPEGDSSLPFSGNWAGDGLTCVCREGWHDSACFSECPGVNSNGLNPEDSCGGAEAGTCNSSTGVCECSTCYEVGSSGVCEEKTCPDCQNNGQCICGSDGEKQCSCVGQWQGDTCDSCPCLNGSTCNDITGACECAAGYTGEVCETQCSDAIMCSGNGVADCDTLTCTCNDDYYGSSCSIYCSDVESCNSPAGECTPTGLCTCPLYPTIGEACGNDCGSLMDRCQTCGGDHRSCCSNHGALPESGVCLCDTGFCGNSCNELLDLCGECSSDSRSCCSDNGVKQTDGSCVCDSGFCGTNCADSFDSCGVCLSTNHSSRGRSCCGDNGVFDGSVCVCDSGSGYCGVGCAESEDHCGHCDGDNRQCCSESGLRKADGSCECDSGRCGDVCDQYFTACDVCRDTEDTTECEDCEGTVQGVKEVDNCNVCGGDSRSCCSEDGTMNADGICVCDSGKCGTTCENLQDSCGECEGDNRSCCSDQGTNSLTNVCLCDTGFCGVSCQNILTECDVCGPPGTTTEACEDCHGDPNGTGVLDYCDVCDGNHRSCCSDQGTMSDTGVCGCDSGFCGTDCSQVNDNCDVCDGDSRSCCSNAGEMAPDGSCGCDDGICGSECDMMWTECGECRLSPATDECEDCHGTINGTSVVDLCIVCGGDNRSCCSESGNKQNDHSCQCDTGKCNVDCSELLDGCDECGGDGRSCCSELGVSIFGGSGCVCEAGHCGGACENLEDNCGNCLEEGDPSFHRGCCSDAGTMNEDGTTCSCDSGRCGDTCAGTSDNCGVCDGDDRSCCSDQGVNRADNICECDDGFCGTSCQNVFTGCGVCRAPGTSTEECEDCNGDINGTGKLDHCDVCDGDNRSCCSSHGIKQLDDSCGCDAGFCGNDCSQNLDGCKICGGDNKSCCSELGVATSSYAEEALVCACGTGSCGDTCDLLIDLCGVCDGDNRSCCDEHGLFTGVGCDCDDGYCGDVCSYGHDICGVCNGDGSSCAACDPDHLSCDGVVCTGVVCRDVDDELLPEPLQPRE